MELNDFLNINAWVDAIIDILSRSLSIIVKYYSMVPKEVRGLVALTFIFFCIWIVLWTYRNKDEWKTRKFV